MNHLIGELAEHYGDELEMLFPRDYDPDSWMRRREELRALFSAQVYGRFPTYDTAATRAVLQKDFQLKSGHMRSDYTVTVPLGGGEFSFETSLYLPADTTEPAPVFLFITRDDWTLNHVKNGDIDGYFPLQNILDRGFALATVDVTRAAADDFERFASLEGMRPLLGQSLDQSDRLGALGIWAFTAMRVMDLLEVDQRVDGKQVAVIGLSRLGKVALLTGAFDERFALTVSINSGQGGAALSRHTEGERIHDITTAFPHWFAPAYNRFAGKENDLSVDQHCLLALVAPRALYVTSSEDDAWADPLSEFRSAKLASTVYETIYGKAGLGVNGDSWAAVETDAVYHDGLVAYHRRTGEHGLNRFDWDAVMDFFHKQAGEAASS